jgi:glycerol-3-phosphate dehydrogenase
MLRDLTRLTAELHDVLVVGGGIHGACVAWEAARRGLLVALVEAGDFNQGTSSNSLRTLHGGLRHLQRLDWALMRESIRERREWLRLAPELTRPLRFVLPASARGLRRPPILRAALWANDLVSRDRNEGLPPQQHLPGSAFLGRSEFAGLFPGLAVDGGNGAAAWYDGVCLNTERLQLAVMAAAVACGARAANYVRALTPELEGRGGICAVRARDEITGAELDLRARMVINAAGPWIEEWLVNGSAAGRRDRARDGAPGQLGSTPRGPLFRASKAFNLLVRKLPFEDALGLTAPNRAAGVGQESTYFIMPWNGYSLIGTRHLRCDPRTRSAEVSREQVLEFLDDLNPLLGEHHLGEADIHGVFSGLLPEAPRVRRARGRSTSARPDLDVALERTARIVDHSSDGLQGVFSVIGVKWTTARAVGERAAQLACRVLGRADQPLRPRALETAGFLPEVDIEPSLATRVVPDQPILFGHVVHAVREEMALHLADVVRRRTSLYLSEALDRSTLTACAGLMARELRWSRRETGTEIEAAERELAAFRGPIGAGLTGARRKDDDPQRAA